MVLMSPTLKQTRDKGTFELSDTSLIDMLGLEESLARKNVLSRVLRSMTC